MKKHVSIIKVKSCTSCPSREVQYLYDKQIYYCRKVVIKGRLKVTIPNIYEFPDDEFWFPDWCPLEDIN